MHQTVKQGDGRTIVGRDINQQLGMVAQVMKGAGGVATLQGQLHATVGVPRGGVGLHQAQGDAQ